MKATEREFCTPRTNWHVFSRVSYRPRRRFFSPILLRNGSPLRANRLSVSESVPFCRPAREFQLFAYLPADHCSFPAKMLATLLMEELRKCPRSRLNSSLVRLERFVFEHFDEITTACYDFPVRVSRIERYNTAREIDILKVIKCNEDSSDEKCTQYFLE